MNAGFLLYYCKLRLSVILGFHKTCNPLDFNWRLKQWQRNSKGQHFRLF